MVLLEDSALAAKSSMTSSPRPAEAVLAVAAVIEAAGGVITDWDGIANDLSWPGRVVAARDPDRHRDVLVLLAEGA